MEQNLSVVSKSSPEAKAVFSALAERQRFRERTDLNRLYMQIAREDESIVYDRFLDVFKELEAMGIGRLIKGRKNNPDRFKWNYNLKEIAEKAKRGGKIDDLDPIGTVKIVRPVKTAPGKTQDNDGAAIHLNIQLAPGTNIKDIQALLQLAKELQG